MDTSEKRGLEEMEFIGDHVMDSDFKLKHFGYGEWVEEPDRINFIHKEYECKIIRICAREAYCNEEAYYGGHFCGYVKLPLNHPYYGKKYNEMNIDCHGALTFGETFAWVDSREGKEWFWIGFDCAHSGDYVPSSELLKKRYSMSPLTIKMNEVYNSPLMREYFKPTYKNLNFCIEECKSIVEQLIVIAEQGEKA